MKKFLLVYIFFFIKVCFANFELSDLYHHQYNKKGEVIQFEYAQKAIEKSPALIGFQVKGKKAVLAMHGRISPLVERIQSRRRLNKFGNVLIASIGFPPDCRKAHDCVNHDFQSHKFLFGQDASVESLSSKLADWLVKDLYPRSETDDVRFQRPLATSVLFVSPSKIQKDFTFVSHTGSILQMKQTVLGKLSSQSSDLINAILANESLDFEDKLETILKCLSEEYEYCEWCIVSEHNKFFLSEIEEISGIPSKFRKLL